jgi:hypothetical protein
MNEVMSFDRQKILRLEVEMKGMSNQIVPEVVHWYGHKSYVRQMTAPAGTVAVGKIHKFKQVHVIISGEVSIYTDDGPVRIQAPCVFTAPAGSKRAAYFHKDTVWLTIHGSEKTDPEELEDELIAKTFEEFDQLCLEMQP